MKRTLLFLSAIGLVACQSPVLQQPAVEWVKATRQIYTTIAEPHLEYVEADPTLTPEVKAQIASLLDDWDFMIRQGEEVHGLPRTN